MILYEFTALLCAQSFPVRHWDTATVGQTGWRRQDALECTWKSKYSRYRHIVPDLPAKSRSLDSAIARHWGHRTKSIARWGNKIAFWGKQFETIARWGKDERQMYLVFSYLKENTHLSMITFVDIVFRKTLCLFGEHWYDVLFLLHCHYMTRRICGIKQVIIVAFFCWLPITRTLFPSLAITSFLRFSYWGITFTQCATKFPRINCYYKHQSSSLLLLLLFL